ELGAAVHLDPTAEDFFEAALEANEGRGADVVIEAAGKPAAMAGALKLAGFRARLVNIGIDVGGTAEAELGLIQSKELQIRGTIGSPGVWPQTLRFLDRTGTDLSRLVTSRLPLEQAVEGVRRAHSDRSQVKVHLTSAAS
ncbi:MAG: zinc-binding dehydrogenase, partial [Actinocrinis sp.]